MIIFLSLCKECLMRMLGREWIGIDISENYCEVARQRIKDYQLEQQQLKIQVDELTN